MNNLSDKMFFKTSIKLKVKKENNKLVVSNDSKKREQLVFAKVIYTKRECINVSSKIETIYGGECNVKVLNRKFKVINNVNQNVNAYIFDVPKLVFIGVSFEPNSKCIIESLKCETNKNDSNEIEKYFKNNILLICPGYPSNNDKYCCSFIHSRVSEYKKHDINVDVAVVNDLYISKTEFYEFEDSKICRTGYNQIRLLLLNKHYDKILIHFPVPKYYRILDAVNIKDTQVILFSHGVDTLFNVYDKIGAPYFTNNFEIPQYYKNEIPDRTEEIVRYNQRPNFKFIFVSEWNRKYSEKLLSIKYNNYEVIPCFIDNQLFKYEKKDPELRKKVFVIRPQNNLKTYSIDTDVRVILELSHRECFKDMEFSIYGDGELHDLLLEPLRKFSNVHIYKKFLSHEEIAEMHKKHGIGLFASRFDTQAVSACEAAMSGNVVITSTGIGTVEYIDPSIGTYCDPENYKEYADLIEKLYNDPKLFSKMSKQMHDSVMKTCSYEYSLKKDIELIKNSNDKEKITIPTLSKTPLLSISIASYNVSKFIVQILCSLLRCKYANELEILVVNDGSKDDTVSVVQQFINDNYSGDGMPVIRLIDKENGGHGSTLNEGIKKATGKYFRLLDGDDYYISENLDKLIEILRSEDSDLVLTNYIEDFAVSGIFNRTRLYEQLTSGVQYRLEDITSNGYGFSSVGPILHTSTYKTELLKNANFKIDEHCFYVDMEYNFIGFVSANTVTYYPLDIYSYYLGRNGQSVSPASFKKNVSQHEKVCLRIISEYEKRKQTLPEGKKKYILEKLIITLCKTQYDIVTLYFKDGKNFVSFDSKLKQYPDIYNDERIVNKRIKLYRKTNGKFISLNPIFMKISSIIRK